MIAAYTTFPNNGKRVIPVFIRRVEDARGNVLETAKIEHIDVVDEKTAFLMRSMLQSVVEHGTGVGLRWQSGCSYKWTAAGKTGTTDDYKDAWFIGFNKNIHSACGLDLMITRLWKGSVRGNSCIAHMALCYEKSN